MIEILSEQEQEPSSYPGQPSDLSTEAAELDTETLWKRIESFIRYRWNERTVTWIVQGPGVFHPRLQPFTLDSSEVWQDGEWVETTLDPAPLGFTLDTATYRITGTVGTADSVPSDLEEAYRRLAEYLADGLYFGRVATSGNDDFGDASERFKRPEAWHGKALYLSGAADLLRRWR